MKQLLLDIAADMTPTLDNFIPGRNVELLHTLQTILQGGAGEHFVYVWGEPGSGRSHLLRAWIHAARQQGMRAAYVPGEIPLQWEGSGLVAVDDVARLCQDGQIALFHLYNRLRESGGALLVSGPVAPAGLDLRPDLLTRLGWGLVYQVQGLNDAEKALALQEHARARGFALPQEVLDYLLRHWRRDLPSLMAVLDALDRITLEQRRPVTVPLLRQLLQIKME
ncbi:MAG: DnaA regulatory inactivator Hda [Nitrosomonadales bacterium]|nr:MAG: DnaA regulatory inactivator Hda [Nitrosomonadales bacterium]